MTTSQKLHRLAAALFVGGLLVLAISAIAGVWILPITLIGDGLLAACWVTIAILELREANA